MNLKPQRVFAFLSLLAILSTSANADLVFIVEDIDGLVPDRPGLFDGNTTADLTIGGLTATFTANTGTLNSNSESFGINDGNNAAANNNDEIGGSEVLTISFDQDVLLTFLDLSDLSGTEAALLTIGSNPQQSLSSVGTDDDYSFSTLNTVNVGQSISLAASNGDYALRSFTVTLASVPEPSAFAFGTLITTGLVGLVARRRRKAAA